MILLLIVAAGVPVLAALGIVIWAKWIRNDPAADIVARGLAIGFGAGIAMGITVGLGLIGLALVLTHAGRH